MYSFYLCPISTVTSLYDLHLLKVKWFQNGIWGRRFPLKTNKNKSTWGIIVVKSNSFVRFLEEIDDPQKTISKLTDLYHIQSNVEVTEKKL